MSLTLSPAATELQLRQMLPGVSAGLEWRQSRRYLAIVRLVAIGVPVKFIGGVFAEAIAVVGFDRFIEHVQSTVLAGEQFDRPDETLAALSVGQDQRDEFRALLTAALDGAADPKAAWLKAALAAIPKGN